MRRYYLSTALFVAVGVFIVYADHRWCGPAVFDGTSRWIGAVFPHWKSVQPLSLLGAMVAGVAFTSGFVTAVYTYLDSILVTETSAELATLKDEEIDAQFRAGIMVGLCEKVLTPIAFILGQPEFVIGWFALKVAVSWNRWNHTPGAVRASGSRSGSTAIADDYRARRRFDSFMIGTSMSLLGGVLVYFAMMVFVTVK